MLAACITTVHGLSKMLMQQALACADIFNNFSDSSIVLLTMIRSSSDKVKVTQVKQGISVYCCGYKPWMLWPTKWQWLAVLSCPGSTTAMLCSMALQATASRSCSEYRTAQLGSFSKHQDDPTLAHCRGCYTGCPFSSGSITKWLCWHSKSAAPQPHRTRKPNTGSRTRPQPAIEQYGIASTFHDDNIRETCFSMLCTSCLKLTTENCS